MSLFGGDGHATSPDETENELSRPSSARSSPSATQPRNPYNKQSTQEPIHLSDIDLADDSDLETTESEDDAPRRPNRFKGRKETWKAYTAADRQIAASLEQIQHSDIAAHLYNAHALKRRVRRPVEELADVKDSQSREHWLKRGSALEYTDVSGEIQTHLVPSKDWTAWPIPSAELPLLCGTNTDTLDRNYNDDTFGTATTQNAGEEIREELLATFSRLAKERWNIRETVNDQYRGRADGKYSQSRSRSRNTMSMSRPSSAKASQHASDDESPPADNRNEQDKGEQKFGHIVGKRRGRKPRPEVYARPTFLADDAKARMNLLPTINSMLSKLDDVILAARRTRLNHFGRGADSDRSSQSDFTSGAESTDPMSRPHSRSRSAKAASKPGGKTPGSRATSEKPVLKPGISKRSDLSDSPSDKPDLEARQTELSPRKRGWSESTVGDDNASSTGRDESWRAGLMDWSEVLGLAAIKGWDQRALARTAQRCSTLFGESMSFQTLDESLSTHPIPAPVEYRPSHIPSPADLIPISTKRPLFQPGTLRCPHVGCYGHTKDFHTSYRVIEHCMRVHDYDPRTNDSDNEERKVGGVHIDGFLQPIPAQHGWLGRGRSKAGGDRKRMRKERGKAEAEAEVEVEEREGDLEREMDVDMKVD